MVVVVVLLFALVITLGTRVADPPPPERSEYDLPLPLLYSHVISSAVSSSLNIAKVSRSAVISSPPVQLAPMYHVEDVKSLA